MHTQGVFLSTSPLWNHQHPNKKWTLSNIKLIWITYSRTKKFWVNDRGYIIDIQTLGFKGDHEYKLWINYKSMVNRYECDVICDKEYILYLISWNKNEWSNTYNDISNIGEWGIWIIRYLRTDWAIIYIYILNHM